MLPPPNMFARMNQALRGRDLHVPATPHQPPPEEQTNGNADKRNFRLLPCQHCHNAHHHHDQIQRSEPEQVSTSIPRIPLGPLRRPGCAPHTAGEESRKQKDERKRLDDIAELERVGHA